MFLLPASQQSCQSSSRKLKHKERKSLVKIIPGECSRVILQNSKRSFIHNMSTRTKQSPLFTLPLDAKHSRREQNPTYSWHLLSKRETKKKWHEYDIDELVINLAHTKSSLV